MASMGYLKKFDKAQLWRFFSDAQLHYSCDKLACDKSTSDENAKKENFQALINGFTYMLDNLGLSNKLTLNYLQKLSKIAIPPFIDETNSIFVAEIRYQASSINLSTDNTSIENIVDILKRHSNDATVIFNTPGLRKIADKLNAEEIFTILKQQGSISYRN